MTTTRLEGVEALLLAVVPGERGHRKRPSHGGEREHAVRVSLDLDYCADGLAAARNLRGKRAHTRKRCERAIRENSGL